MERQRHCTEVFVSSMVQDWWEVPVGSEPQPAHESSGSGVVLSQAGHGEAYHCFQLQEMCVVSQPCSLCDALYHLNLAQYSSESQ